MLKYAVQYILTPKERGALRRNLRLPPFSLFFLRIGAAGLTAGGAERFVGCTLGTTAFAAFLPILRRYLWIEEWEPLTILWTEPEL
jgi:hypothetical protein